eukprot:Gb_38972 [translate_table: standard]
MAALTIESSIGSNTYSYKNSVLTDSSAGECMTRRPNLQHHPSAFLITQFNGISKTRTSVSCRSFTNLTAASKLNRFGEKMSLSQVGSREHRDINKGIATMPMEAALEASRTEGGEIGLTPCSFVQRLGKKKVCLFYSLENEDLARRIAVESDAIELRLITWSRVILPFIVLLESEAISKLTPSTAIVLTLRVQQVLAPPPTLRTQDAMFLTSYN